MAKPVQSPISTAREFTDDRRIADLDMDALLDAIANPPVPNEAMLRSIARWRAVMGPSVDEPIADSR